MVDKKSDKSNPVSLVKGKALPVVKEIKAHPWRICPIGSHLVRTHSLRIPASKMHPQGLLTTRHQHCARNSSKKDLLSFPEIQEITQRHFSNLNGTLRSGGALLKEFKDADKFDDLIRGWVGYWNEVFKLQDPLDPNLVKALIATESSFDPQAKNSDAHGLMQVMESTHHILNNHKGELKNYLIDVPIKNLVDPSANICMGVRWLFRKKQTASARLRREVAWMETIADYKSYLKDMIKDKTYVPDAMKKMREYYDWLQR